MKLKLLLVSALLVGTLAACGTEEATKEKTDTTAGTEVTETEEKTDAVAAASVTDDPAAFVAALGEDGTWIVAATSDITLDEELVVAGEFTNKNEGKEIYRKLALYSQDEDRNVTGTFTLTVPKMTVQSENFKIQNGTVVGDVVVEAKGFSLTEDTTIDGNLYFASEEAKSTAVIEGKVTGVQEVSGEGADTVSAASITDDPAAFTAALGEDGTWIVAATADINLDKDLVVAGEFTNKNEGKEVYRKLALYSQDEDRNVTGTFTLTVPKMTVQSENFKIQNGTVVGDVVVEAKGFSLTEDTTIDGNLYFASEDLQKSAVIEGKVTRVQEVK